jgi:hypothetical protein
MRLKHCPVGKLKKL